MIAETEIKQILDEQTTIEWLPINEITFDTTYQRQFSVDKVKAISSNYNSIAAGTPLVNIRLTGEKVGMDGRHRIEAMKKRGIMLVECKVCRGLTVEQEAQIFVYCNTMRKNPSALDVFKARLAIKTDKVANEINETIEKCGLTVVYWGTGGRQGRSPKGVFAVGTLEEIYHRYGKQFLEEILLLVIQCWPDNGAALEWLVLKGMAEFHSKYKGKYSREALVSRMSAEGLPVLMRRAKSHADLTKKSTHITFAAVIQEVYDKGRRTHRLEPDKI